MEVKDVVIKGNVFEAKFTSSLETSETSPEYVLNGTTLFQVRVVSARDWNGRYFVILVLAKFSKRRPSDEFDYQLHLTSPDLLLEDKIQNDDGVWHVMYESNKWQKITFTLKARVENTTCMTWLDALHDDTELTDFELRGVDGGVRVHRAALAAASPVLRCMLAKSWREATQGHVDMPDVSTATLQHLKDYIYKHELPETGLEQLILLASFYMMPCLEQQCADRLVGSLTAETTANVIEFAAKNNMRRLLYAVLECVQTRAISVTEMRDHDESLEKKLKDKDEE